MDERFPEADRAGHPLASEISERVREVIGAAEAAAGAVRHEAEQRAHSRRRLAEEEAKRLLEDARHDAEALLAERIRRISELSDTIIERGEAVLVRIERAAEAKRELESLVQALAETAATLAHDTRPAGGGAVTHPSPAQAPATPRDASPSAPGVGRQPEAPPAGARAPGFSESSAEAGVPARTATENGAAAPEREGAEAESPHAGGPAVEGEEARLAAVATPDPAGTDLAAELESSDGDDDLLGARLVALQMAVAGANRGEVEDHLRHAFELAQPSPILDDVFGLGTDASKRVTWPSAADA